MSNDLPTRHNSRKARYRQQQNEYQSETVNNNDGYSDVNYDRTQQLPVVPPPIVPPTKEELIGLRRLFSRRRQRREEKKSRKHNNNNMGCQQSVALADNRQKPSSSTTPVRGGAGANTANATSTTTRKVPATTTTKPKPFVVPTAASGGSDNETPQVTISYPPPPQSSVSTSISPGIGKNRSVTNPKLSSSPGSANGTKKIIPTSWNKAKGVGKASTNSALPPPPPLMARPRTDTWEINLAASPAPLDRSGQGGSGKSGSVLESTYELVVVDVNDNEANEGGITTTLSSVSYNDDDGNDALPKSPSRLASAKAAASQQSKALAKIKSNLRQQQQQELSKYTVQDQWKMLWDTQSNNLVDPADVLAVVDTLLDKTVNRLSPVQVTFIQRKVRYAINKLYTKPGTTNSTSNNKKLFGGSNNNANNNNAAPDYAEARVIAEKYHLIPEIVVRHMILPKVGSNVAGTTGSIITSVTNNVIALMLSLSSTSSESYLWDRTAFAASAAAEIAKLEMDVNKRYRTQQVMPKPSQVPIIEGAAQFPPGITLTALSAIIAIAISSTSTRQQKLQLLFYICFKPENLIEFLISHPAGGVATWLLEVDNHVVISLSSLTHYHYYGHAFLPTSVPMFDDVPPSTTDGNNKTNGTSNDDNAHIDGENGSVGTAATAAARKLNNNGSANTNSNETTTSPRITKRRFIPSQSRKPATVPLDRVHTIIDTILQIEQQNVRVFQEKKLDELNSKDTTIGEASVATTQNETTTTTTTQTTTSVGPGSILRRSQRGGTAQNDDLTVNTSSHHNSLANNSLHKKLMGRRVASQNNLADIDSSDSIHGGGGGGNNNNNSTDVSSCFTVTDVMGRLLGISSPVTPSTTSASSSESDSATAGHFCYPADDSTTQSSLDISREQFLAGTSIFVQNRYGVQSVDSVRAVELSMEEFVHWAEIALDDLALNIVLHKIFAEGILPSPSLERDLVLSKWLEWQQTIRAIMAIANATNHRQDNNDNNSLNNSNHVDKDGFLTSNGSHHSSKTAVNNLQEEVKELSYSMQALLTSTSLHNVNGESRQNGESNGTSSIIPLSQILSGQMGTRKGNRNSFFVWGGLGNVDGGGGIGYGVLYCISKEWWNQWTAYTGWTFADASSTTNHFRKKKSGNAKIQTKYRYGEKRPWTLSTEDLIEHDHDSIVRGSMGSYEVMRQGLVRGEDYVLVPPGVWDVLYEMYGGGPPLPRMIRSLERRFSDSHRTGSYEDLSVCAPSEDDFDMLDDEENMVDFDDRSHVSVAEYTMDEVEIVPTFQMPKAVKIPDSLSVTLHPWIIHVHLCDPTQPYRRGDAGPVSIRLMATPYQPLWRLFAEIICRFSFQQYKAFDADGRGKTRLWKKTDPIANKEPVSRYGPWNLLCKSRHAILPIMSQTGYGVEGFDTHGEELIANWKEYVDNATVETGGLSNNDHLMLEFAVQSKNGELTWPREAAAKAGRVRRLAEEDKKFRYLLQGLSEDGTVLLKPPSLVGLDVDAMDSTGRWYTVRISDVDIVDDDTDDEMEDDVSRGGENAAKQQQPQPISRKKVKVIFKEHGGQTEWIDVESDRLATAGRFASQAEQDSGSTSPSQASSAPNINSPQSPSKAIVVAKKTNAATELTENAKLCTLPGFGACGLGNLGNTCYMNSALQCLSYLPMLRSYLISAQYKSTGDLNKDNVLGSGGKLLEETAELMRSLWSSSLGERSPTRFRTILGKANPQFSGADQQDAQEFLNYIIDALHEDSYKGRTKPYTEPLEDDWVNVTNLARVGEEAWRRFLRRNRSVMADVAMGQALNTVTCPVCKYSSRNFDPFNLLSIPIPTVAEVVFQCTVYRRATAKNCPWVLAKVRKGDKRQSRFDIQAPANIDGELPPSEHFIAERYYVALSRLADSGDLRLQIQNLSGIRANQLRLCRIEEVVVNEDAKDGMVIKTNKKVFPLSDKDGPASQQVKKRTPNDENKSPIAMTEIVAFEMTLNPRILEISRNLENGDDEEEEDRNSTDLLPSPKMAAVIERHLEVYGDDYECRMVDTDSLVIAKAVSRSLWPRSEDELKLGLRVDAMDHRGNWFPGSVIEIVDDKVSGANADPSSSPTSGSTKRVRVHFDNFSPKWDENYSIEHFVQGRVKPLYSHAIPKRKPTEFLVHHRHTDRQTGHLVVFGQSFYVQCQNEWSNARAGAHILAQVCRFMHCRASRGRSADSNDELEMKTLRLYEKTHSAISDLIDLLVDCDREYVRLALGVSQHNNAEEKSRPFRNPTFDASLLSSALVKKVTGLLQRLPFEVRICTVEGAHSDKPNAHSEEVLFPFSLVRTIGNFMNIRHAVFLQWREPTVADKKQPASATSYRSFLSSPVMYIEPKIHVHEASASLMNEDSAREAKKKKGAKGDSTTDTAGGAGIELSYCLKEFCKVQKLSISDSWKCPICKVHREGGQNMNLWRLPDLLTFHIKRFNMSARWHEKITTKVNFPITGLDMRDFCHAESPVLNGELAESSIYDLIGVMNHYGSMTGGHYVATCKATACSKDGREEVAYGFNGIGASTCIESALYDASNGVGAGSEPNLAGAWVRLGGARTNKNQQEIANQNKLNASIGSRSTAESAEPMWLQFDDEVVEPIPPAAVVSEMAYVLFYRRRNLSSSNIVKYSTLE